MTIQVDPAVLVQHLDALAQAAALVAQDLRSGLADLNRGEPHAAMPARHTAGLDALLGAREVAAAFGVGIRTLRRWRHEKRIPPPLKMKGPLRWRRTDIDRWLEDHRQ